MLEVDRTALQGNTMRTDRVYPYLGPATSEISAGPRNIEEPCTTALALDPPQTVLGGDVDAWSSGRKPRMLASSPQFLADGIGTDMVVPHSVCNPRADCFGPSRTTCREPHSLRPSPWRPYSAAWRSGRTWTWRLR